MGEQACERQSLGWGESPFASVETGEDSSLGLGRGLGGGIGREPEDWIFSKGRHVPAFCLLKCLVMTARARVLPPRYPLFNHPAFTFP